MNPAPPDLPGLTWRPISQQDLGALVELSKACLLADGGLPFLFAPEAIASRYFPDGPGAGLGAFTPQGRLAASAAMHADADPGLRRVTVVGQVHPAFRRQGLGGYLVRWSQAQAQSLKSGPAGPAWTLRIATESLAPPADCLYRAHGFEPVMEELVMQRDLDQPLPAQPFPPDVTIATWRLDLAPQFYEAYHTAFRERPGFPGWTAAEWTGYVTENDHMPDWTLLASVDGSPSGFLIGNIDLTAAPPGGYIWQVGVVPAQRRRGLASALLVETMRRMQQSGAPSAQLTVHINNPGAIQAYAQLGFRTIGRRARYEKTMG